MLLNGGEARIEVLEKEDMGGKERKSRMRGYSSGEKRI